MVVRKHVLQSYITKKGLKSLHDIINLDRIFSVFSMSKITIIHKYIVILIIYKDNVVTGTGKSHFLTKNQPF